MNRNSKTNWTEYDDGFSIGTSGEIGGAIVRDEEHAAGARITLEEESGAADFALTCLVYDWMFHTRYFSEETEAENAFDEMKGELDEILAAKPSEEGADEEEQEDFAEQLADFVERYP